MGLTRSNCDEIGSPTHIAPQTSQCLAFEAVPDVSPLPIELGNPELSY